MLAKVLSYGLDGMNGYPVSIETDIYNGMPSYELCGLPDASVKESRERVRSAIKNSGFEYPAKKITVNLAPADQRKEGPMYDLPIAVGLLAASGQVGMEYLDRMLLFGELALDGSVRPISGLLPMVIQARQNGYKFIVAPYDNRNEIRNIEGIRIYPLKHLKDLCGVLNKEARPEVLLPEQWTGAEQNTSPIDFSDIRGQDKAKRAMEIAAAGGHNILLIGSPGSGKSMLAKALPGILPDFTFDEALEVTQVHSVAGELHQGGSLIGSRPFRAPHHTASPAAIVGGGSKSKPGEISLAHHGVLYFDELPEFQRSVLEALRQPLEDGTVSISRANTKASYPADFMFVASMNPCPCGNFGANDLECRCTAAQISRYLSRISGPLLDRLDIHVELGRIDYDKMHSFENGDTSAVVRRRVNEARKKQNSRYAGTGRYCNAQLDSSQLEEYCPIDEPAQVLLKNAYDKLKMSARSYTRLLLVARTVADLDNSEHIMAPHIAEAIQYRTLDRKYWSQLSDQ